MKPGSLFLFATVLLLTAFFTPAKALECEITLSVYQGPCADGDFKTNLATVRDQIDLALECGSDFVVFPETFLSGYDSPENVRRGARKMDDPDLTAFIQESKKHQMVIVVGLVRIVESELYNTVLVIHRGKLLGTYDKCMLTTGDRDKLGFIPGRSVPVFSANGTRFSIIICHDTSFPHLAMIAKLKGAELLFTPHYNSIDAQNVDDHRKWVRNCHTGLACQMKLVVARSNVIVTDKPARPGYGNSFIMSPMGETLTEAKLFRTELITAQIKPEMFEFPYVWANFNEIPQWIGKELADLLVNQTGK